MADSPLILEVAVPSPLLRSFDYRMPAGAALEAAVPGIRVRVPFGRRQVTGIVLATRRHSAIEPGKLRPALQLLDRAPVLDDDLMQLLLWAARYYHHPIGEVMSAALPVLLRQSGQLPEQRIRVWTLTEDGHTTPVNSLARAPRQAKVLAELGANPGGLRREQLDVPLSVLNTLEQKGWITRVAVRPQRARGSGSGIAPPRLGEAQRRAVDAVAASSGKFDAFLLEGVTGSGKTEVYLRLIEPLLAGGHQALVLVPEIGLTPQLVKRFSSRFDTDIAILHSGLNDSQRLDAWQRARSGAAGLILGTRSAIFTPLARPGLIIVDEEHDSSFKQQDGFRYSARDLAVWRARQLNIPVLLGSATPSLESLYNVAQQRYRHLGLPERAGQAVSPVIRLIDLRGQPMRDLLSRSLTDAMEAHLAHDGQVLLFLNRRGFSPVLLCHRCGWVAECTRCDARMTLHRCQGELRCHHCDSRRRIDVSCPACGADQLIAVGEGTERIAQALADRFPQYPVLRVDRDTTRGKGQLEAALTDARSGRARILLGTQMLAKGHHFPRVTLAAILAADQGLFSSDFRASERLAQTIVQVAGRAGRADRPGEVLIQTHHPDHPLLRQLVEHGYPAFAAAALKERGESGLPPFASMALLRAEATNAANPHTFLERAAELARRKLRESVQIWGPVSAPMQRRAGRYRAQLLVLTPNRPDLQHLLSHWIPQLETEKTARRVRWSIDVDPVDTF
jgi:primosomal protein N' (replication factor Y)